MKDNLILKEKLSILCQKIYPVKILLGSIRLEEDLIEFAKRNRLGHFLALEDNSSSRESEQLKRILRPFVLEYDDYKRKIKNSLRRVRKFLGNKEFMIIKTFSSFPHLTSDIDILVKDIEGVHFPVHIEDQDACLIHIENKISWVGADAVSNDFAWRNTQKFNFDGETFLIPNAQLDTIIRMAHIPFEVAHIKLGELLHIYREAKKFDWQQLEEEAQLMKWPKTFARMVEILEMLHWRLFERPFLKKKKNTNFQAQVEFPFELPFGMLARGVIEKRAWKKLYGARFILKERVVAWINRKIS